LKQLYARGEEHVQFRWAAEQATPEKKGSFFLDGKVDTVGGDLGVAEVADLEPRRGAAVQQRVLQLQVSVANLLRVQFCVLLIIEWMEEKKNAISVLTKKWQ
jgi:Mg2+/Co2+ transporter CorC